jgi:hypothetical protein
MIELLQSLDLKKVSPYWDNSQRSPTIPITVVQSAHRLRPLPPR